MAQQKGFLNEDFCLDKISKQGDSLRKLNEFIDWEMFCPISKKPLGKKQNDLDVNLHLTTR